MRKSVAFFVSRRYTTSMKAYYVDLHGTIDRTFLVHAESAAEVREIMAGDRSRAEAVEDHYQEIGCGHVKRAP